MFLAQIAEAVEVTGSQPDWPAAIMVCAVCFMVVGTTWAMAWSIKRDE